MDTEKFTGFVLRSTELSASRVVLTLFTREGGKRKGVLRLARNRDRAYLSPLTCLDVVIAGKEHQELKRISEVSLRRHCYGLASDYLGLSLLAHWAFLLNQSQPDEQEDERVYRLLDHALLSFEKHASIESYPPRNLYFEVWLLHFCGMLPRGTDDGMGTDADEPAGSLTANPVVKRIFESRIERVAADALQWGSLTGTLKVLGTLWERFLSKELKTRELLMTQFRQRRLL